MPQALPSPEQYAEKLQNEFQDKSLQVVESIRNFTTTHLKDNYEWDLNIYFDQVKAHINEIRH
jgi:hypothetical protein